MSGSGSFQTSSFVRKGAGAKGSSGGSGSVPLPSGTRPSLQNGQLLISSGLHQLDSIQCSPCARLETKICFPLTIQAILGGGIAVGTIVLVEEDSPSSYYRNLLKYFVSEGLAVNHEVAFVQSSPSDSSKILKHLPTNLTLKQMNAKEQPQTEKEKDKEGETGSVSIG